jgi:hypothetical protein
MAQINLEFFAKDMEKNALTNVRKVNKNTLSLIVGKLFVGTKKGAEHPKSLQMNINRRWVAQ